MDDYGNQPRKRKGLRSGGFTLIELLVVVAIIALLISILLPSLSRAKAQARQVVCNTHLMSLGKCARLYAADNKDYIPRGIQGFGSGNGKPEYTVFGSAILKYLGYDGDTTALFPGNYQPSYVQLGKRVKWFHQLMRDTPQFQCPDFPDEASQEIDNQGGKWRPDWETCPFDFNVSAFAIPYPQDAIDYDDGLQWQPSGGNFEGEWIPEAYVQASKLEDFPAGTSPAGFIYITEVHKYMPWNHKQNISVRFFTCFLASQLPFAGKPRIANDQRHPGGINALFFDSHADTMELHQIDPGDPNPLSKRLRWFTVMPYGYVE